MGTQKNEKEKIRGKKKEVSSEDIGESSGEPYLPNLLVVGAVLYPPQVETSFRWFPTGSQFDLFRSYISHRKSFLPFKLQPEIGFFETSDFFYSVDSGGWRWMVVDGG